MKKVLIISTSIRSGSNSEFLAHEFEKGAKEAGNDVTFISLKDKQIAFCRGCLACQKTHKCIIDDDAIEIADGPETGFKRDFAHPQFPFLDEGDGFFHLEGIHVTREGGAGHLLEITGKIGGGEPHEIGRFGKFDRFVFLFDLVEQFQITGPFLIRFAAKKGGVLSKQIRYDFHDLCVANLFV